MSDDIFDEIGRFDQDYVPQAAQRLGLDSVPDDFYELQLVEAEPGRTKNSGQAVLKFVYRVTSGPRTGLVFENTYFLSDQKSIDRLGGDLIALGLDADRWTPRYGKSFSAELKKALPLLAGVRIMAKKSSKAKTQGEGYFHNLYILSRLKEGEGSTAAVLPINADQRRNSAPSAVSSAGSEKSGILPTPPISPTTSRSNSPQPDDGIPF